MSTTRERAIVLLSGGIDSSTCLAIASQSYQCHALTVGYGQRNVRELESARRVAHACGVAEHAVVELDLSWIGGSALTSALAVPKSVDGKTPAPTAESGIPVTYVPARNSLFLCLAAAWADALGSDHLFIGVNQVDYSGYPDCRPAFIDALQRTLRLGTRRSALVIHTPLMDLTKGQIVTRGTALGLDYSLTWSCYDPVPVPGAKHLACGRCDSCIHRKKGFAEAGLPDPTPYQA